MILVDSSELKEFPAITVCPVQDEKKLIGYNMDVFRKCEVTWHKYLFNGYFIGAKNIAHCSDPKVFNKKLLMPVKSYLNSLKYRFFNKDIKSKLGSKSVWVENHLDRRFGRCYTAYFPVDEIKKGISEIEVIFNNHVYVSIHSPGRSIGISNSEFLEISVNQSVDAKVDMEVVEKLSTIEKACVMDKNYTLDNCYENKLFNMSMKEIGCATPFSRFKVFSVKI